MLQDARERFGDPLARFIPPHVTLLPPTEIDAPALDAFEEHLEVVAETQAPFRMMLAGTGTFRPAVAGRLRPGVVGHLAVRASRVAPCGVGRWQRRLEFNYHPHVTVAHNLGEESLDEAFEDLVDFRCTFDVTSFELFQQTDDGVWGPLSTFALEG